MAWYDVFQFPQLIRRVNTRRENRIAMRHENDIDDAKIRKDHEYGGSGTVFYADVLPKQDYNPKFVTPALYDTVDKMRKGDSSIAAVLAVVKLPLLRTEVNIIPGRDEKKGQDGQDRLIAETCQKKLLEPGSVHESWQRQLRHYLLMLDFGFSPFEKVWTQDDDGFLRFAKLAPRLPQSVTELRVNSDGSLRHIVQQASRNGTDKELRIPAPIYGNVFSWNKEGENHWGETILRPVFKHWFYKEELYRIDAVRLDRWGTGIPRAKIAENYNLKKGDRADLIDMLKRMRGGEQAYLMHPEQVDIDIMIPGVGGSVDLGLMNSVYHHDLMIYRSVLAHFIATANSEYGNYGSTRTYSEVFFFAEQAMANYIEDAYQEYVIKPFCDANFTMDNRPYPRLQFADVQKFDMGLLSEVLSRLGQAGLITPDDDMEAFLRKTFGWPKLPEQWSRDKTGIINPAKIKGIPGVGEGLDIDQAAAGGTGTSGRPKEPSGFRDQKVDQRPVINKQNIARRIIAMNERLAQFLEEL